MSAALPKDATLIELRADALVFRTRECLLPGTPVDFVLKLEGQPLAVSIPVTACLVVEKDRAGYVFHIQLDLAAMPASDRQLVALFITKGRGSPELVPAGSK